MTEQVARYANLVALAERLSQAVESDYASVWLHKPLAALDDNRGIDAFTRGEFHRVDRVIAVQSENVLQGEVPQRIDCRPPTTTCPGVGVVKEAISAANVIVVRALGPESFKRLVDERTVDERGVLQADCRLDSSRCQSPQPGDVAVGCKPAEVTVDELAHPEVSKARRFVCRLRQEGESFERVVLVSMHRLVSAT